MRVHCIVEVTCYINIFVVILCCTIRSLIYMLCTICSSKISSWEWSNMYYLATIINKKNYQPPEMSNNAI